MAAQSGPPNSAEALLRPLLRLRASKICQARSVAQAAGNLAKSRSRVDLLRLRSGSAQAGELCTLR